MNEDTSTMGVIKNVDIPARYPLKDVFGDHDMNDGDRLNILTRAVAFQKAILELHGLDSNRVNFYPTLYIGLTKQGETYATIKKKLKTRTETQLLASKENYHFCTVGAVSQQPASKYITLEQYDQKYREVTYERALEIVVNKAKFSAISSATNQSGHQEHNDQNSYMNDEAKNDIPVLDNKNNIEYGDSNLASP